MNSSIPRSPDRMSLQLVLAMICGVLISSHAGAVDEPVAPPRPYGPLPSARQLRWHELQTYAFLHFSVNTFTDKEWGYGDESPTVFQPTDFDAEQIVTSLEAGGLKEVVPGSHRSPVVRRPIGPALISLFQGVDRCVVIRMEKQGNKIVLTFDHVDGGFRPFDVNDPRGFSIAGSDRKFV